MIIEFKRHITDTRIFCIIISELSYWKKPSSVVLFVIDKSLKVGFYNTIFSFDLLNI